MKITDEVKLDLFLWSIIFYAGIGLVCTLWFGLIDLLLLLGFGCFMMIVAYLTAYSTYRKKIKKRGQRRREA